MKNLKTKIVIGTSRLGWHISKERKNKILRTLSYALEKKLPLHTSTLYGSSIAEIGKNFFPLDKYLDCLFLKVDFQSKYSFFHQIFYAIETLGFKKKINIQIENHFKPNKIEELNSALEHLNKLNIIDEVYLSATKSNSKEYLNSLPLDKFNIAVHFSLVEREFEENIIDDKKNYLMAVRALGQGLDNLNFKEFNVNDELNLKKKQLELNQLISKNNISVLEARSKYILNHPKVDFCVFSTSKISHLEQLIKHENENFPEEIWNELNNFSKITFNQNNKIQNQDLNYKDFFLKINFLKSLKIIKKLFKKNMVNLNYCLFYFFFIPGNIFYNIKKNIYLLIYYIYKKLNY